VEFNEARDDQVALASAGPYANHCKSLHLTSDRQPCQHLMTKCTKRLFSVQTQAYRCFIIHW